MTNDNSLRRWRRILAATILALPCAAPTAGDDPSSLAVRVDVAANDTLSVTAHDANIEQVLEEISRQTSLVVYVHGALARRVDLRIRELSLAESVRRVLTEESFVLYRPRPERSNQPGGAPGTLWVFAGDSPRVLSGAGTRLGKAPKDLDTLRADIVNEDAGGRRSALRALRKLDAGEAVLPIGAALSDDDAGIRVEAIYALADLGGEAAAASLTAALADEHAWVRREAVYALGATGGATAVEALRRALRDPDRGVRETAIEAYTDIGGEESARALRAALSDPHASVREEAALALGEIGGTVAVDILGKAADDADDHVRRAVLDALAGIGGDHAARVLDHARRVISEGTVDADQRQVAAESATATTAPSATRSRPKP